MHILGAGPIGCLVAASQRNPALILRNEQKLLQFHQAGNIIRICGSMNLTTKVTGVTAASCKTPINQLIVATKAHETVAALQSVKHVLNRESTIVLLQNGMGVENELKNLFSFPPKLAFAITSQGSKRTAASWTFETSGNEPIFLGSPDDSVSIPGFKTLSWDTFQSARVKKLLVNAVINPLTAIVGCPNGQLRDKSFAPMIQRIVQESVNILNAEHGTKLDVASTVDQVLEVAKATKTNTSSMLADVERGSPTEIDYINGYILRLCDKHQMRASLTEALVELVKLRGLREAGEAQRAVPFQKL